MSNRCAVPMLVPLLTSAFVVLAAVTYRPFATAFKPYPLRTGVTEPTVSSRSIEPLVS